MLKSKKYLSLKVVQRYFINPKIQRKMEKIIGFLSILLILTLLLGSLTGAKSLGEIIRRGLALLVLISFILIVLMVFVFENPHLIIDFLSDSFNIN